MEAQHSYDSSIMHWCISPNWCDPFLFLHLGSVVNQLAEDRSNFPHVLNLPLHFALED